jgi:DNA-binding response OmpR family regulator
MSINPEGRMIQEMAASTSPASQAMLVLFQEGLDGEQHTTGQHWELGRQVLTIGRGDDNDIVLPDRSISRHHAEIRRAGSAYAVHDLNSKNGVFVNGTRVTGSQSLANDDRIQLSPRYSLCFVDAEATAPMIEGHGDVLLDQDTCQVWVKGVELDPPLSGAQFRLLQFLLQTPGCVHSRDSLRTIAWPDQNPSGISDEAINSLIRRLRNRLMEVDPLHRYVYAVRGHGFRFQQPGSPHER